MVSKVYSTAFEGIEAKPVLVEAQITSGLPAFNIVGLADKAVAESRERIRASLQSIGLSLPAKRITVNLAPADLQKEGSHYDLPIALAILGLMGAVDPLQIENYIVMGEIGLDARISKVHGILSAAITAVAINKGIICPQACALEARWAGDLEILAPQNLLQLIHHFKGTQVILPPSDVSPEEIVIARAMKDLSDVKGQVQAKRALEIAAAGGHNLLMIGPPGSGKSMIASRLPSILPELSPLEALQVSTIHSICGLLPKAGIMRDRPYRDPHHSASLPALVGGGSKAKPGEISLAHHGVLFLDELPEFSRQALEALRQPLETGQIVISRVNAHVTYPAQIQLIGAMNPCRCGYFGDPDRQCSKAPNCAIDYQAKLSGPLMDRFDMILYVQPVKEEEITQSADGEKSELIAKRVQAARIIQLERFKDCFEDPTIPSLNTSAEGNLLDRVMKMEDDAKLLSSKALNHFKLSARGYHRMLRVSRTIADLENCENTKRHHVAEALNYRRMIE
jgi:magnesium chelatase family protein